MKFFIAVILLAAVVGVYSESQQIVTETSAKAGGAGKGPKNLSEADITEIEAILRKIVGPKLSGLVTELVSKLANSVLGGLPLGALFRETTGLVSSLLKSGGTVENLLAGGDQTAYNANEKGSNGKIKNLTPQDQAKVFKILRRTLGPFTANYLVRIIGITTNGLLGNIPLNQLVHGVGGLVKNLANPKGLVGKLIGQKGLGKPISKLLGAKGPIN